MRALSSWCYRDSRDRGRSITVSTRKQSTETSGVEESGIKNVAETGIRVKVRVPNNVFNVLIKQNVGFLNDQAILVKC
jgi:hypothetical protein